MSETGTSPKGHRVRRRRRAKILTARVPRWLLDPRSLLLEISNLVLEINNLVIATCTDINTGRLRDREADAAVRHLRKALTCVDRICFRKLPRKTELREIVRDLCAHVLEVKRLRSQARSDRRSRG